METTEEKVDAVTAKLQREFPKARILYEHDFDSGDHKFRIDDPRPRCWLHLAAECVADHDAIVLVNFLNIYNVIKSFQDSTGKCRLRLTGQPLLERL